MPELPEVETVRRGLERIFAANNVVKEIKLTRPDLRVPIPAELPRLMRGQAILGVRRRAKYLLIDSANHTLISHLGMSGTWRVATPGDEMPHDHVYLTLGNGTRLAFNDPRRFGILDIARKDEVFKNRWLEHLGVEPFDDAFDADFMLKAASGRAAPVKNFLMDQKIVVGVGNIYASEVLFMASIKPLRQAKRVKREEWQRLIKHVRTILQTSINKGGTTLKDHRMVDGEAGDFQTQLRVYDREGQPCRKCKKSIRMQVVAGRSTYWCATCQK